MTYGQLKADVLRLIHQYSIAGNKVATTYNNQQDYLNRIPSLANDALVYLATTARRLREVADLSDPVEMGNWLVYTMPGDFWQLCPSGIIYVDNHGNVSRTSRYKLMGENKIAVPKPQREIKAEYFRYPVLLRSVPEDSDFIDCPMEAQSALSFYIASHLEIFDDPYIQATFYNEFENKLSRLGDVPAATVDIISDEYGSDWGGW